jgi:hypothetical protein
MEEKKVRRIFTPEQKFEILKDIERCATLREGLAAKPDRAAAQKVAHYDAIGMSLAYGNLVDPNDLGSWSSYSA